MSYVCMVLTCRNLAHAGADYCTEHSIGMEREKETIAEHKKRDACERAVDAAWEKNFERVS